jgi:hypothetical protein
MLASGHAHGPPNRFSYSHKSGQFHIPFIIPGVPCVCRAYIIDSVGDNIVNNLRQSLPDHQVGSRLDISMKDQNLLAMILSMLPVPCPIQQANLAWNPIANTKFDCLQVRVEVMQRRVFFNVRAAFNTVQTARGIDHDHYVGGVMGHDWSTRRDLLHARFLTGLRRQ